MVDDLQQQTVIRFSRHYTGPMFSFGSNPGSPIECKIGFGLVNTVVACVAMLDQKPGEFAIQKTRFWCPGTAKQFDARQAKKEYEDAQKTTVSRGRTTNGVSKLRFHIRSGRLMVVASVNF